MTDAGRICALVKLFALRGTNDGGPAGRNAVYQVYLGDSVPRSQIAEQVKRNRAAAVRAESIRRAIARRGQRQASKDW